MKRFIKALRAFAADRAGSLGIGMAMMFTSKPGTADPPPPTPGIITDMAGANITDMAASAIDDMG
jgi:hypothetical protein